MSIDMTIFKLYQGMSCIGTWIALLGLRLLLAWEFWGAGVAKLSGSNWFENIVDDFPFPFSVIPVSVSWFIATWTEIVGSIALVLGLATRFWALGLTILTLVALFSVHADNGYNVCDNGFKLPLIYLIMLIPLLLMGPGNFSIDHFFAKRYKS